MPTLTTAQQVAKKREEIDALIKRLKSEISVGSVAKVLREGRYGDALVGSIVKVTEIDPDDGYDVRCHLEDGSDYDMFKVDDIQILTREEARQALLDDIERRINALFDTEVTE